MLNLGKGVLSHKMERLSGVPEDLGAAQKSEMSKIAESILVRRGGIASTSKEKAEGRRGHDRIESEGCRIPYPKSQTAPRTQALGDSCKQEHSPQRSYLHPERSGHGRATPRFHLHWRLQGGWWRGDYTDGSWLRVQRLFQPPFGRLLPGPRATSTRLHWQRICARAAW